MHMYYSFRCRKWIIGLLVTLSATNVLAKTIARNFFCYAQATNSIQCIAIGSLHASNEKFALMKNNNGIKKVCVGDVYAGKRIIGITETAVKLSSEQNGEQIISLQQRPFNLKKLKG